MFNYKKQTIVLLIFNMLICIKAINLLYYIINRHKNQPFYVTKNKSTFWQIYFFAFIADFCKALFSLHPSAR